MKILALGFSFLASRWPAMSERFFSESNGGGGGN